MLVGAAKFFASGLVRRKVYHKMFSTKIIEQTVPGCKTANINKEEAEEFDSLYPMIVKDLLEPVKKINVPDLTNWCSRMMEYNLLSGKQRGHAVVLSYKLLEDSTNLTKENIRLASILGWSTELLGMSGLMIDDLVDQSDIRRGIPCWYKLENVGFMAVIDAVILENNTYLILSKYFRDHPCYLAMVELFHNTALNTQKGQVLDRLNSLKNHENLQHFTMDKYETMSMYKSGFINYCLPVRAAMYLAGIQDAELHGKVTSVLYPMGFLGQIKNDFLDCFGDVNTNGTTLYGDIRQGKCTWPAVVTLQRATCTQRAIMERCYGRPDDQSVHAVMDVYRALDIPNLYARYEEEILHKIHNQIEQIDSGIPKKLFYNLMEML